MSNNKIYSFAIKWLEKFKTKKENFHQIFETVEFPDECWKIGFEMDGCRSFDEKYSLDAFTDLDVLKRIIYTIDEVNALGNLIFSKWRWFNHSDYIVYKPEDEEWFIIALTRLAELTRK